MPTTTSPAIRQIKTLLQDKLIPWVQEGAPQIILKAPPRSLFPIEIKETATSELPSMTSQHQYPHVRVWPSEGLNSIDVPVLGCIFEGQSKYQISRPPGETGMLWTIPLQAKTFFLIPPGIPFTRGIGTNRQGYARGMLVHLRRDCISCFTYTLDQSKVWQMPYVLLHEFDAQLLVWRLIEEWSKPILSNRIIYHYTSLILDLMLRSIQEKRFTNVHGIASTPEQPRIVPSPNQHPAALIEHARSYINTHLANFDLSCSEIALNSGVSLRHLERLFKSELDITPFEFVTRQRLEKAKVLLQGPGLSVRHVAYYCGFRQAAHFSKWFSRQTGLSPREFRQCK